MSRFHKVMLCNAFALLHSVNKSPCMQTPHQFSPMGVSTAEPSTSPNCNGRSGIRPCFRFYTA
ncbi:hypothetical protein BDV23DRAFT_164629 [Aspergillus alliaceus]|uniref:Uncharacterized protein n=1 Tax=Petromyces alliaceus TaxID=209559 RepID=A0A5N7BUV8_PETAA|nr:hypothetical protein BDV23DRAFT_164629 [Aspergillus alliaceus]